MRSGKEQQSKVLKGNQILIRNWIASDKTWFKEVSSNNQDWLLTEAPWLIEEYNVETELLGVIEQVETQAKYTVKSNLIVALEHNDTPIGFVSSYWRGKETNWLRIGIRIIGQGHQGKGYGTAAISLWISYLFSHVNELNRIGLTTWSGNKAMVKLAKRLGMKQEALHRKARSFNGKDYDALGFGLLREEWQ